MLARVQLSIQLLVREWPSSVLSRYYICTVPPLLYFSERHSHGYGDSCVSQSETLRPIQCARSKSGFTLNIIDTPGLVEGGCINDQALDIVRRYTMLITLRGWI